MSPALSWEGTLNQAMQTLECLDYRYVHNLSLQTIVFYKHPGKMLRVHYLYVLFQAQDSVNSRLSICVSGIFKETRRLPTSGGVLWCSYVTNFLLVIKSFQICFHVLKTHFPREILTPVFTLPNLFLHGTYRFKPDLLLAFSR